MPYENQVASKVAHSDITRNPDIRTFLGECDYLTPPSDEECQAVAERFVEPPEPEDCQSHEFVLAVDGSTYESSIDDRLPSTKIGFLKTSAILIDLQQYGDLRVDGLVDPFRVAALQNNNSALTFSVPSANIRWADQPTVRESFRAVLDRQFDAEPTRFNRDDPHTSLRSTLFHMASRRPDEELHTGNHHLLKIHKCPRCGHGPIELNDEDAHQYCPHCRSEIYPTDCLRIWEEVSEYQSNQTALSRLMLVLEHLIPFHYMRFFAERALGQLSGLAFFIDGPLAMFGNPAWLHRTFMIYLAEINRRLGHHSFDPVTVIGLQKTGQIVDHVNLIARFVPNNRLFAIDDNYRYQYILAGREPSANGFGYETYYGQDFIYKTPGGSTFVLGLPYPWASKNENDFVSEKVRLDVYPRLGQIIELIKQLESDLYQNAVVPIALAHKYTAISLQPGGQVLDILTRRSLEA